MCFYLWGSFERAGDEIRKVGKGLGGNRKTAELVIILHHVFLCPTIIRYNQQSQSVVVDSRWGGGGGTTSIGRLKAYHFCSKGDADTARSSKYSVCFLSALLSFPWVSCLKFRFLLFLVMLMLVGEDVLLNCLLPPKYWNGMGISEAVQWYGSKSLLTTKWFKKIWLSESQM